MIPGVVGLASELTRDRQKGERTEGATPDAELNQLQLQSHFLLDKLQAVSVLLATDLVAARTLLAALRDLLRSSLEPMEMKEAPLSEEIALIGKYLDARSRVRDATQD
jgi:LytS/YehU family sensor histidine kinase